MSLFLVYFFAEAFGGSWTHTLGLVAVVLGNEKTKDDYNHAYNFNPRKRLLSNDEGGGERKDGADVHESRSTAGAELLESEVIGRIGKHAAEDAEHEDENPRLGTI